MQVGVRKLRSRHCGSTGPYIIHSDMDSGRKVIIANRFLNRCSTFCLHYLLQGAPLQCTGKGKGKGGDKGTSQTIGAADYGADGVLHIEGFQHLHEALSSASNKTLNQWTKIQCNKSMEV